MNSEAQFSYTDVFQNSPKCDQTDQLYRYFLRTLSNEQRNEFERHLSNCEPCMLLLMQLSESESAAEKTVMDAAKSERAFEQARFKIQDALKKKYGGVCVPPPDRTYRKWTFMNAMLLVAIAILIYPAYRSTVLDEQIAQLKTELNSEKTKQPVQPPPTLDVRPILSRSRLIAVQSQRGGAEENTLPVEFGDDQQEFTLLFSVPSEDFQSYRVEIKRDDKIVWQDTIPATGEPMPQLISVVLNAQYFQQGDYFLRITGQLAERQIAFPEYMLTVSSSK